MADLLYRLGRFSFRRAGSVAAVWVGLLVLFGAGAVTLSGPTSSTFSIPGTQAQEAIDLLQDRFPEAQAGGASARVVFAAPKGQLLSDPANAAAVAQVVGDLQAAPEVAAVTDPFLSGGVNPAGTVGFAQVTYTVPAVGLSTQARDALAAAAEPARAAGLTVEMGGDAVQEQNEQGLTEVIGVAVAAVVLVITFGSLIAAGLPLLTAIVGVGIGLAAITTASGFIDLSSSTSSLALMLGLAVAIDYGLFIVSRYRHELADGRDGEEAAGRAVATAGSAVVFAGLTVVIALAALAVVGIPFLTQMGLAAAFTVGIAVLIAVTLLPAVLRFTGRRIMRDRLPGLPRRDPETSGGKTTIGLRWARFVTRHPVAVLLAATVGLGVFALPALDLRLGMPDDSVAAPDTTQRKAYDLLSAGFGPGVNGPLMVVVDASPNSDPQAAAQQIASKISGLPDVATVTPPMFNQAGDTGLLQVVPVSAPSSADTKALVTDIRRLDGELNATTHLGVTGQTAVSIDMSQKLEDALLPYLAVVVGLALVLLMLVFRSILIPLKATVGFLLSVAATFGAVVAVFKWGWLAGLLGVHQTGPIFSMLPILLVGVVFGLAMDYQIFLVTRMREEHVHGATPSQAVVTGFAHGARVVTAAATIMISVFAGFILSEDSLIKSVGLALAAAVLFDAFIVRMTLVPAVMTLLGHSAWWLPGWLQRALPNLDVEGENLTHRLHDETPAAPVALTP